MDLKALEYPTVISAILTHAKTTLGQTHIRTLTPLKTPQDAIHKMAEITTAKTYIEVAKDPSFGDFFDIESQLKDIKIARTLSVQDLQVLRRFFKQLTRVINRLKAPVELPKDHALTTYMEALNTLKSLAQKIDGIVDDEGLRETASSGLKKAKNENRVIDNRLMQKLKSVVDQSSSYLSESFYTERHGRYVVPVKQTYKNRFKGSVVDYSASGETIYMEPHAIGELSAQKRRVEATITAEIEAILTAISTDAHAEYDALSTNHQTLGSLDAIFAKAHYATEFDMAPVTFTDTLNLYDARHPLIDQTQVVANDIVLDETTHTVIISGSNTGGKTVVLKTVGLLALMAQAGLLIPVKKGSSLPFYTGIYADIGDEQSIEQSLSTFSSHLTHIQSIMESARPRALILLDEIGGGTDPKAGAAFARSLLDALGPDQHDIFVTTHYPELKAYAYDQPAAINASVAFDKSTLQPTYHLYLDTPGESHALLIAERLGFPESILKQATVYYENAQNPVSDLIQTLEQKRSDLEKKNSDVSDLEATLSQKNVELSTRLEALETEKQQLKDRYERMYQRDLEASQKAFDEALSKLQSSALKQHEINQAKDALYPKGNPQAKASRPDHTFTVGDRVHIEKFNRQGTLKKKLGQTQWLVEMGSVESTVKQSDFYYVERAQPKTPKREKKATVPKKKVAPELDLRGKRVDEAKIELDKYLDDCALARMPFVRIIHGYGTFAIRDMVQAVLQESPFIESFRAGQGNEGGAGVTVVYF